MLCSASGLHVLIVDVLPPTSIARGLGASVAREIGAAGVPEAPSK